jgi:polysaccharide export outer membrane protein
LRLGNITTAFRRPTLRVCAAVLGLGGLGLLSTGCDMLGLDADRMGAGFIAPGEMMRFNQRQPLMKPILDTLSSGFDEPNEEYPNARNIEAADLVASAQDYVIARNDLLQLTMTEVTPGTETAKTSRVSESGNITLPLVGQVRAAGLTEAELEASIRKTFDEKGMIKGGAFQVSVTVLEAGQKTFQIRGAVGQPGQYALRQSEFRLLDALILARDVTAPELEYAYVIRPPAERSAAATQPSTQPASTTTTPAVTPVPGGNLLEPHTAAPASAPAVQPVAEAPKPNGASTLEDATKTTPENPKVFVNGNDTVPTGSAATMPATSPTTAPSDILALNPPANSGPTTEPTAQNFQFNPPLPEDTSTIIRIPLRQLLNGDLKFNVVIKPLDTIVIPTPTVGEFYMGNHVARVGVYSLNGRSITLKQAIISAGMLDDLGIPERTEIIRRLGRDREIFVKVNLAKVFRGEQPDIFLKPYDIVMVGTSPFAPFLSALRNGFRITYGFGFIYDRNYYNQPNTNGG